MRRFIRIVPLVILAVVTVASSGQAPALRPRGALPSPRERIFAAPKFVPTVAREALPASFGTIPKTLSYWLNNQYGCCVTAEEAFGKACYSVQTANPELVIPDAVVYAWARAGGYLNGATLTDVMASMAKSGFTVGGTNYTDGPYASVDYTNDATLSAAIMQGPVKIGVAAGQLEGVVGTTNGWFGTGFRRDGNLDHCVSLCGFGTTQALATMLGVQVPSGVSPTGRSYLLFTWNTIGIIDQASMIAITGEAWLRTPTTPQTPIPTGTAPQITSAASTTWAVGQAGSFQILTTGNPVPTITQSGALPTG